MVIHSVSWTELLENVVFERFHDAFLSLNLAKREFGKATTICLGKEVGQGPSSFSYCKIKAVIDFPMPENSSGPKLFFGNV